MPYEIEGTVPAYFKVVIDAGTEEEARASASGQIGMDYLTGLEPYSDETKITSVKEISSDSE
jgi:hypothetical protein